MPTDTEMLEWYIQYRAYAYKSEDGGWIVQWAANSTDIGRASGRYLAQAITKAMAASAEENESEE